MDYRNLPVGRTRRLAYSINLENRRRTREISTERHIIFRSILNISPINTRRSTFAFFEINNLENLKIGLINKNLLLYSKIKKNIEKDYMCIICQEIIEIGDIIRKINCNHIFHINCIDTWFTQNHNCPTCKFIL